MAGQSDMKRTQEIINVVDAKILISVYVYIKRGRLAHLSHGAQSLKDKA
jgi:hypothetical protein